MRMAGLIRLKNAVGIKKLRTHCGFVKRGAYELSQEATAKLLKIITL